MGKPSIEITDKQALTLIVVRMGGGVPSNPKEHPDLCADLAELVELGLVDTSSQLNAVLTLAGLEALSSWERGYPMASSAFRRAAITEDETVAGAFLRLRLAFSDLYDSLADTWPFSKFRRVKR